jgi:Zn-dependent protease
VLRVGGTELAIDPSWLLIFAFVTWTTSTYVIPVRLVDAAVQTGTRVTTPEALVWIAGVVTSLLVFGSILLHEAAHAAAAVRTGIPVRRIRLFVFGGVAEIAAEPSRPRQEFVITVVGPLASGVLGGVLVLAGGLLPEATLLGVTTRWLGEVNLMLAAFNLLPGFPLDGGRLLRSAVWAATGSLRTATRVASLAGSALGIGLILYGVAQFVLLPSLVPSLWAVLVGWFVWSAARSSYRDLLRRERLAKFTVRDILRQDHVAVPDDGTVSEFIERRMGDDRLAAYPVVDPTGSLLGVVSARAASGVPPERRASTLLRQVVQPPDAAALVRPDVSLLEVFAHATATGRRRFLVLDGDRLVGWIDLADAAGDRLVETET